MKAVKFMLSIAVALGVTACEPVVGLTVPDDDLDVMVQEFVSLVNAHRQSVGCESLTWHAAAAEVALAHSEDMVARGYFDHTNPDGQSPFDRLNAAGIFFRLAGENIAAGHRTAEAVLDGWLNSPGHRANIENCGFTHHGLGLASNHWTHLFLTPN
jgi:uncharacterized protein YkwD